MFVRVVRVLLADGLSTDSEFTPPLVALGVLHVGFEIYDEEGDVDSHPECHCFVDQNFLERHVVHHLFTKVELHGYCAHDLFEDVRCFQVVCSCDSSFRYLF